MATMEENIEEQGRSPVLDEKCRVLIIEDDEHDFQAARRVLLKDSHTEYECLWSKSLLDARRQLSEQTIDIALLDLGLPDSDTMEGLKDISSLHPELTIVVLSRHEGDEGAVSVLRLGAQGYLSKHQRHAGLARTVRHAIERKQIKNQVKQAEQAAVQATLARTQFLANMSHEIRTPMNGILGMAELLQETHLDDEQCEMIGIIKDSADALLRIINDVLDSAKIDSDKLTIDREQFNLHRLVLETTKSIRTEIENKQLQLKICVPETVPWEVNGDSGRVRQVLINLLSNALKFTPPGGTVSVSMQTLFENTEHVDVLFSVTDTGIGIPPDKLEEIFQPFSQVDNSLTRPFAGTGLGLSISNRLVQLMGGALWVKSTPDKGSCFQFTVRFKLVTSLTAGKDKSYVRELQFPVS